MQININRYYKDNQVGYRFHLESGLFADRVLTDGISRGLIGCAIGNRSVNCWLGGIVGDAHKNSYYVFGHNEMKPQEAGSNRLSCLFTFALIPFESLHQLGSASRLMEEISRIEKASGALPESVSIQERRLSGGQVDEQIVEKLAAYAADQSASVELVDSLSNCVRALETIWTASLFARKMPVVALVDEDSAEQPQNGWRFYVGAGQRILKGAGLEGKHVAPENAYLYYAYAYAMIYEQERCRSMLNPSEVTRLRQEFGSVNDRLLEQLLLWYYALNRRMEMLPTEEEKNALMRSVR